LDLLPDDIDKELDLLIHAFLVCLRPRYWASMAIDEDNEDDNDGVILVDRSRSAGGLMIIPSLPERKPKQSNWVLGLISPACVTDISY